MFFLLIVESWQYKDFSFHVANMQRTQAQSSAGSQQHDWSKASQVASAMTMIPDHRPLADIVCPRQQLSGP
jgi:hypothetical protein